MTDPTTGIHLLKSIASRGIPSIALILGATACQDDPVYFYPEDDASTDTGGGGETDTSGGDTGGGEGEVGSGDTGSQDTGGGEGDVGGEDTGEGDTDTGGGEGDTSEGDTDTGDTEDTDTDDGDTDTGEVEEPLNPEDILRRFCVEKIECETGESGSTVDVLTCMGEYAYYLEWMTTYYSGDAEACLDAYMVLLNAPDSTRCVEYISYGYYGPETLTTFEVDLTHPLALQQMATCAGVDLDVIPVIEAACTIRENCWGSEDDIPQCVKEGIMSVGEDYEWVAFFECVAAQATCEEGWLELGTCQEPGGPA